MTTETIKQNTIYTIKGYNPMMSVWMEIAKLETHDHSLNTPSGALLEITHATTQGNAKRK